MCVFMHMCGGVGGGGGGEGGTEWRVIFDIPSLAFLFLSLLTELWARLLSSVRLWVSLERCSPTDKGIYECVCENFSGIHCVWPYRASCGSKIADTQIIQCIIP